MIFFGGWGEYKVGLMYGWVQLFVCLNHKYNKVTESIQNLKIKEGKKETKKTEWNNK
jgi:hypothetical protein